MVGNLPINAEVDIKGDAMIYSFPESGLKRARSSFYAACWPTNTLPQIPLIVSTGRSNVIINRVLRARDCSNWLLTDLPLYYTARESAPTFDIAFDSNRVQ
jgi:hypothetical protein